MIKSQQYYLPPEWAPQSAVMLTWPWPRSGTHWSFVLPQIEKEFVELAKQISLQESLIISCYDEDHYHHVEDLLLSAGILEDALRFFVVKSDDSWARDHGPLTVLHPRNPPLLLDFTFNGWGNKYPCQNDNQLTKSLYELDAFQNAMLQSVDFVLEGGSIEVDGNSTLMTTTSCLLNKNRNGFTKAKFEKMFRKLFGVQQVLWLEHGNLEGDDTDGHIDNLARFINSQTICYMKCDDKEDPHYPDFLKMQAQIRCFKDAQKRSYELVPLPWPKAKYDDDGNRLPVSYANFLMINGAILVPIYGDSADDVALERLQIACPDKKIIGINCCTLIQQYGSLHCATMQLPNGI